MEPWLMLLVGLAAGAGLGWMLCAAHGRDSGASALREAQERAARAESLLEEVRRHNGELQGETVRLRADASEYLSRAVAAQTRAAEFELNLKEQVNLLAGAERKLSDTFKALAGEV